MTLTVFDPRLLTTTLRTVHPLADLASYLQDVEETAREMQEQILDEAYRTEDDACTREAAALVADMAALLEKMMKFEAEWIG